MVDVEDRYCTVQCRFESTALVPHCAGICHRFFPVCDIRNPYPLPHDLRDWLYPANSVVAHLPREEPALTTSTLGCSSMLLVVELLAPRRPRRDIVKMDSRLEIPSFVHCFI
jgi:hypothetical protein